MNRRGRAGEIVNLVDLDIQREGHVVAHDLEIGIVQEMGDVVFRAGEIIVDAENVVAALQQLLAQMRTQKSGATGYQYALTHFRFS